MMMKKKNSYHIPNNIRTALTDLFQIRYPIVLAGMGGGLATPQLVSAVSNAGGLGVLGANGIPKEQLRIQIHEIKSMTTKPFGVNFLLAHTEKYGNKNALEVEGVLNRIRREIHIPSRSCHGYDNRNPTSDSLLQDQISIAFEERVPIIAFGLGDPSKYVQESQELGIKVTAKVTSVKEAVLVADGGVDAIESLSPYSSSSLSFKAVMSIVLYCEADFNQMSAGIFIRFFQKYPYDVGYPRGGWSQT
jgi:nitronate monooxygenase